MLSELFESRVEVGESDLITSIVSELRLILPGEREAVHVNWLMV